MCLSQKKGEYFDHNYHLHEIPKETGGLYYDFAHIFNKGNEDITRKNIL